MAVQTITYEDKSYLNQNADIPATNKVQDTDMNEIKTVVNNNANETNTNTNDIANILNAEIYSTNEIKTNKIWIDENNAEYPIYRKRFNIQVDSDSNLYINHNLQNINKLWLNEQMSFFWGQNESLPLNYYYSSTDWCRVWVTIDRIRVRVGTTNFNPRTAYVTVEYTKTTDYKGR